MNDSQWDGYIREPVRLRVNWTEVTKYEAELDAPRDFDPALLFEQQSADVQDALWDALHERVGTYEIHAEDEMQSCKRI